MFVNEIFNEGKNHTYVFLKKYQLHKLKLVLIYHYLRHLLTAHNTRGHGIHSPFVFQFVENVIYEKHPYYIFKTIEQQREKLFNNHNEIFVTDFGACKSKKRKISEIAHKSLKRKKIAQLLYRTAVYFKSEYILELGTSLGITTAYLSANNFSTKILTLEGCPETSKVAKTIFDNLGLNNIEIIEGNIDTTLEKALEELPKIDFIFIDANHRFEPLMDYFVQCVSKVNENTIMFIDDIYWSFGMKQAWEQIKQNDKVTATLDVFETGIVFFNPALNKKHYKLIF